MQHFLRALGRGKCPASYSEILAKLENFILVRVQSAVLRFCYNLSVFSLWYYMETIYVLKFCFKYFLS